MSKNIEPSLPSLQEQVRLELFAAFNKAGLENSLRTLITWVRNGWAKDPPLTEWQNEILSFLGQALRLYEYRYFLED
jgi:hypothetical protein